MFIDQSGHQKNMVKNMWVCNNINVYRSEWTSEEYSSVKNMWVCNKVNVYRPEWTSEEYG